MLSDKLLVTLLLLNNEKNIIKADYLHNIYIKI
jgi:hypothetical protein